MKKIGVELLGILIFILGIGVVKAETVTVPTIKEIADALIEEMPEDYEDVEIELLNNVITFKTQKNENEVKSFTYTLNDNILESDLIIDVSDDMEIEDFFEKLSYAFSGLMVFYHTVATVQTFHGLEYDSVREYLEVADEDFIQNNGIEFINLNDSGVKIKIDVSKKMDIEKINNYYFTPEKLEVFLQEKEHSEKYGRFYYHKFNDDKNEIIMFGEKNEDFTDQTYKSLLSIVQVMFENNMEVLDYFKNNYSNLNIDNREFPGFKIEKNVEATEYEKDFLKYEFNDFKYIKVTVKRDAVMEAIQDVNKESDQNDKYEDEVIENPKTGWSIKIVSLAVVSFCGVGVLKTLKRKNILNNV